MKLNTICKIFLISLSLFATTFVYCSTMKIIYDNDAASDDAAALLYLLSQPNVEIKAITIAGTGEAHGLAGAKNFADLCFMMNRPAIPIAYGRSTPLSDHGKPFPEHVRKAIDGLLVDKNIPKHPHPAIKDSAVNLLQSTLRESQEKITILATGPLTNIAELLQSFPDVKDKIEKIVFMGGALKVKGNIKAIDPGSSNDVAEWNVYADPMAASIVLHSGVPVTMVSLDATNQLPLTREFYNTLKRQNSPAIKFIYQTCKDIADKFSLEFFLKHFYLWDPLAAMIAISPDMAMQKQVRVEIYLASAQTKLIEGTDDLKKMPAHHWVTDVKNANSVLDRFLSAL